MMKKLLLALVVLSSGTVVGSVAMPSTSRDLRARDLRRMKQLYHSLVTIIGEVGQETDFLHEADQDKVLVSFFRAHPQKFNLNKDMKVAWLRALRNFIHKVKFANLFHHTESYKLNHAPKSKAIMLCRIAEAILDRALYGVTKDFKKIVETLKKACATN